MTHAHLFSDHQFEHMAEADEQRIRGCHATVQPKGTSFHSDVNWTLYDCPDCQVTIYAVGGAHWWNYEVQKAPA